MSIAATMLARVMQVLMPDARMGPADRSPSSNFWYQSAYLGLQGVTNLVGGDNAHMFVSTCFAATRLLCGIGSTIPINKTVTRIENGLQTSSVLTNDPIHRLINGKSNGEQVSIAFRSMLVNWQVNRGTGFAEIQRDINTKRPLALWPIHPSRLTPFRNSKDGDSIWWEVRNNGSDPSYIPDADMLRIPYIMLDDTGLLGIGVATQAMRAIGLAQTLERTENTASQSAVPRIAVEHPKTMALPEQQAFRSQWKELYNEGGNGVALVVGGATIKPLPWSAVDSDHRARREFSIEDLARWYDVPLTLLRRAVKETAGNVERIGQEFQTYSLKFLEIWEQELDAKLLTEEERNSGHSWRIDYKSLLRADHAGRASYYSQIFSIGGIKPVEVRVGEDMNPTGQDGENDLYIQGAMRKISDPYKQESAAVVGNPKDGKRPPLAPQRPSKASVQSAVNAIEILGKSAIDRMATKETKAVLSAATKPREFTDWIDSFYAKHEEQLAECLNPVCDAANELGYKINSIAIAKEWCSQSKSSLVAVTDVAKMHELSDKVEECVKSWSNRQKPVFCESNS